MTFVNINQLWNKNIKGGLQLVNGNHLRIQEFRKKNLFHQVVLKKINMDLEIFNDKDLNLLLLKINLKLLNRLKLKK